MGGDIYVELHHQQILRQPEAAGEAGAGRHPMLPAPPMPACSLKPAQMPPSANRRKIRKRRRKVINFLLNSKEGVDTLALSAACR